MKCKKCGGTNLSIFSSVYTKSQRRSILWNLLMLGVTSGFWLFWMLVRKNKEKTFRETLAFCQSCEYKQKV